MVPLVLGAVDYGVYFLVLELVILLHRHLLHGTSRDLFTIFRLTHCMQVGITIGADRFFIYVAMIYLVVLIGEGTNCS